VGHGGRRKRIPPRQIATDAVFLVAVVVDAWLLAAVLLHLPPLVDAVSWWVVDLEDPYRLARLSMVGSGAFRYAPPIALVMAPLHLIPWTLYAALVLLVQLAAIRWMAGRRWPLVVLCPPVLLNLQAGNIDTVLGAAVVAGFRWPAAWAFLLLTKVTPGVGVLWFAFRREWRALAVALGTTALIALASYVVAPHLWPLWIDALLTMTQLPQSSLVPPLVARLPLAVFTVWFAARTDRRWLLPVACFLAVPNPWAVTAAILGASVALFGREPATRCRANPSTEPSPPSGGSAGLREGSSAP
jgi:hypothetical protein